MTENIDHAEMIISIGKIEDQDIEEMITHSEEKEDKVKYKKSLSMMAKISSFCLVFPRM
jgi:hypothetical protein